MGISPNQTISSCLNATLCGAVVLLIALGQGCAKSQPISVRSALSESGSAAKAGTVAVPFLVVVKHRIDGRIVEWPDPALTDRLAALLLDQGFTLLDRSTVKKVLAKRGLSAADIEREDDLESLGKALGADVLVLSRLILVEAKDGRMFEKKLSLRGIRASDGRVLFSLSAVDTTAFRHLRPEDLLDAGLGALANGPSGESQAPEASGQVQASASAEVKK